MSDWNCNKCKNENDISLCSRCDDGSEYIKRTNADRIRSMSDEEMADLIASGEICAICPFCKFYGTESCYIENDGTNKNCSKGIMKWLQSEVEE